ncbi:hypothetical protein LguiA_030479 [Lonicera macranthoides]
MYGEGHVKKKRRGGAPSSTSAASAADLAGEYDVFLSFRGIDTRNGFTDYLYHDLVDAGVRTFRDDNELRVGEEIGPELLRAIKQSKISIPIFSKNYASSKWCLREFTQMVDCRANREQMIYPIFYDVEPNEVQHCERGSYKDAFLEHKKDEKLNEEIIQQWMKALETIGDLKGWELKKVTNSKLYGTAMEVGRTPANCRLKGGAREYKGDIPVKSAFGVDGKGGTVNLFTHLDNVSVPVDVAAIRPEGSGLKNAEVSGSIESDDEGEEGDDEGLGGIKGVGVDVEEAAEENGGVEGVGVDVEGNTRG